jgi:hypothetical protein
VTAAMPSRRQIGCRACSPVSDRRGGGGCERVEDDEPFEVRDGRCKQRLQLGLSSTAVAAVTHPEVLQVVDLALDLRSAAQQGRPHKRRPLENIPHAQSDERGWDATYPPDFASGSHRSTRARERAQSRRSERSEQRRATRAGCPNNASGNPASSRPSSPAGGLGESHADGSESCHWSTSASRTTTRNSAGPSSSATLHTERPRTNTNPSPRQLHSSKTFR